MYVKTSSQLLLGFPSLQRTPNTLCHVRSVLDKTLKDVRGLRLDNRKVLRAPGCRTKYFERLFL